MLTKDVEIIEYSRRVDFFNSLTHAIGAVLSAAGLVLMLIYSKDLRHTVAGLIYGFSLTAVYAVSAVYHGLKCGEAKRLARLIDHSTVPLLIAGTATPFALIPVYDVSKPIGIFMITLAWGCTLFGIFSKIFFFEKLKNVTLAVYIISCLLIVFSAVPLLGKLNTKAFGDILLGDAFYLAGALCCLAGVKRPALHVVFHILAVIGSAYHFVIVFYFLFLK